MLTNWDLIFIDHSGKQLEDKTDETDEDIEMSVKIFLHKSLLNPVLGIISTQKVIIPDADHIST